MKVLLEYKKDDLYQILNIYCSKKKYYSIETEYKTPQNIFPNNEISEKE